MVYVVVVVGGCFWAVVAVFEFVGISGWLWHDSWGSLWGLVAWVLADCGLWVAIVGVCHHV